MGDVLYDPTLREILPEVVGRRIVDLLQHDRDDFAEVPEHLMELCLDNGSILRINLDQGCITYIPFEDDDATEASSNG